MDLMARSIYKSRKVASQSRAYLGLEWVGDQAEELITCSVSRVDVRIITVGRARCVLTRKELPEVHNPIMYTDSICFNQARQQSARVREPVTEITA